MASHLSSIGFAVSSEDEFRDLFHQTRKSGRAQASRQGLYYFWSIGGCIEMWAQAHKEGLGLNPHYSGPGRMSVRVTSIMQSQSHPLDGSIQGWADPDPKEPDEGAFPFVVDLPDFDLVRRDLRQDAIITVQVAAFAHEISCYESDEAFNAAQTEMKWAPESFVPTGLFGGDEDGSGPTATALFAGHVLQAELSLNPATGLSFHHLLVRTLGGTVDVVVDPTCMQGEPVVGGVVQGTFWLSGRVIKDTSPRIGILRRIFGSSQA